MRHKIPDDKKRVKTAVSIDNKLLELLNVVKKMSEKRN